MIVPELLFSIVIPTYNRADLLVKTIESLLKVAGSDYEVIIVDDGGNDHTSDVVEKFASDKLKYFHISNRERGAARNFGLQQSKGEYVNFFDSDDLAYPNHLTLASEAITVNTNISVFALSYHIRNGKGKILKDISLSSNVRSFITEGNHLSCNGVFIRRDIALENPFSENRDLSGSEDYELWLRLSARYPFPCFPRFSHAVIQHDERSTTSFDVEKVILRKKLLLEYAYTDKEVIATFSDHRNKMFANTYAYIALHLALTGKNKKRALKWYFKCIKTWPMFLFKIRRSGAILKHIFLTR